MGDHYLSWYSSLNKKYQLLKYFQGYQYQQLKWDGRDSEGNCVATGVYLLMIYHHDGKNTIEKITVINKS